jgi:hypothetical protein
VAIRLEHIELGSLLWLVAVLLGMVLLIVAPRVAWYVLVSHRQQVRYAKQVQIAASRGVRPPPEPPSPPDLWRVQYRFSLIGGALGLAGALIAIVALVINSHR